MIFFMDVDEKSTFHLNSRHEYRNTKPIEEPRSELRGMRSLFRFKFQMFKLITQFVLDKERLLD